MKIIITESQYNLLFENKKFELLFNITKYENWKSASHMVGGIENLKKLTGIETPIDFLNIFTDLDVVQSEENSDLILFRYEKKNNIMAYIKKYNDVYINYDVIWSFLKEGFDLNYSEIQQLIKEWLSEAYNLRGVTTYLASYNNIYLLSEAYNLSRFI